MNSSIWPALVFSSDWRVVLHDLLHEAELIKDSLRVWPYDQGCPFDRDDSIIFLQDDMIDIGELEGMRQRQSYDAGANNDDPKGFCLYGICLRHTAVM